MLQNILNNKKTGALILGGLAAFAYYKYSKLSPEEKTKLTNTIKEKGKGLMDQFMPGGMKNAFSGGDNNGSSFNQGM